MAENNQLDLVLNQAEQEQSTISQRLEKAMTFVHAEREQLKQLEDYQAEYLRKIKEEQNQWSVDHVYRYRNFCYQINDALEGQKHKLQLAEKKVDQIRHQLTRQQHKISVLGELLETRRIEQLSVDNKFLQKELDEFSSRQAYHS